MNNINYTFRVIITFRGGKAGKANGLIRIIV